MAALVNLEYRRAPLRGGRNYRVALPGKSWRTAPRLDNAEGR